MTDNEIKKALECCTDNDINSCEKCPIRIECYTETIDCKKEALDLINRQQAEIEELTAAKKTYESIIKNSFFEAAGIDIDPLAEIKAEAIKEYKNKVKSNLQHIPQHHFTLLAVEECLDEVDKEMAGDAK